MTMYSGYNWPTGLGEGNTTYKSKGVHTNRDSTAKMPVEPTTREGVPKKDTTSVVKDLPKEAAPEKEKPIGVDERAVIASKKKDVGAEALKAGHKKAADFTMSVEPGGYDIIAGPGTGRDSGWGREGTQDAPATDQPAGMQGMAMGGLQGLPAQIGKDIASKDDAKDRADNTLFESDSARLAHEMRAEREQGR